MIECSGCHGNLDAKFPKFTFRIGGYDMDLYPRHYILKRFDTCVIKV